MLGAMAAVASAPMIFAVAIVAVMMAYNFYGVMEMSDLSQQIYLRLYGESIYEYHALTGARRTLAAYHPIIFLATHSPEVHGWCCDLLRSNGYTLTPLDGRPLDASNELLCIYEKN